MQRTKIVDRAVGLLSAANAKAVGTLRELLSAKSESIQLAAARSILELSCKLRENLELSERLEAVEDAIKEQTSEPSR